MSLGLALSYFDGVGGQEGFKESFTTVDVGVLYWLRPKLKLGLSGLNLLTTIEGAALKELNPQRVRVGVAYSMAETFQMYADLEQVLSSELKDDIHYGFGVETFFKKYFSLRFGAFKRPSLGDLDLGTGLSFMGPRLQIHYGFRQNRDKDTFLNSIDFSIPLW